MTQLKDDPLLSFNDSNRDHVDLALRYKKGPIEQTEYRHELDRLTAQQLAKRLEEKRGLREFEANRPVSIIMLTPKCCWKVTDRFIDVLEIN